MTPQPKSESMPKVSLFRLYVLRAAYLLVAVGIALTFWPPLIDHGQNWPLMTGTVCSMLAAVSLGAALGLRYPLQMLPVLLFELAWKTIWLAAVALPFWLSGQPDSAARESVFACVLAAILIPAIPWRYVFARYVTRPGERWTPSREARR
jgi:hypothetical protein